MACDLKEIFRDRLKDLSSSSFAPRYGNNVAVHIIPFSHGALHVARMGSVYTTMSVTLERFFAVVHPLKKYDVKKFLIPGTVFLSVVYNIPKVSINARKHCCFLRLVRKSVFFSRFSDIESAGLGVVAWISDSPVHEIANVCGYFQPLSPIRA